MINVTKKFLGYAFICIKCRETKGIMDMEYSSKNGDYSCKCCGKRKIMPISVYKEDIDKVEMSNDSTEEA